MKSFMQTKKRTIALLRSIGFKMPMALLRSGSMGSISHMETNVNLQDVDFSGKNFAHDQSGISVC
jgi:hypothetical protein